MLEALYVVEFGDLAGPTFQNGGVAVLETNRVFGGGETQRSIARSYNVSQATISRLIA
jgi:hypothetical protein